MPEGVFKLKSIKNRIIVTNVTILSMFVLFVVLYFPYKYQSELRKENSKYVNILIHNITPALIHEWVDHGSISQDKVSKIISIDSNIVTMTVFDLDKNPIVMAGDPVEETTREKLLSDGRYNGFYLVNRELLVGDRKLGDYEIIYSNENILASIIESLFVSMLLFMGLVIIGIKASLILADNIVSSILKIALLAKDYAKGVRNIKLESDNFQGEMKMLAVSFNEMVDEIHIKESLLLESKKEAEEAAQVKTQFLAKMSHELQTPLNGILGMTDLTLRTHLTQEQREFILTAKISAEKLTNIIRDIVDFSTLNSGVELIQQEFSFREILYDVVDLFYLSARDKGVELLVWEREKFPDKFAGDQKRVKQILTNLISNAVKFTEHGAVCIECEYIPKSKGMGYLKGSVEDTGVGVDQDNVADLFTSFHQLDNSFNRKYQGTGLGLAACRELLTLMDGSIHYQHASGGGSIFTFEIPLTGDVILGDYHGHDAGHINILTWIQDKYVEKVVSDYLKVFGFSSYNVEDKDEFIHVCSDNPNFNLVIVDVNENFEGALKSLLDSDMLFHQADVPIFVLSSEEHKKKALDLLAEIDGMLLMKPFSKKMFYDKLIASTLYCETGLIPKESVISEANTKILVVDDNVINQKVAGKMLAKMGYKYDVAKDGQEAIDQAKVNSYDLILMDCQMPNVDGFTATQIIRMDVASKEQLPIVALTANASEEDRENCKNSGMNDFLAKPFNQTQLKDIIMVNLKY